MREIKFRAWDKKHKRMWHFNEMCFAGACLGFEEADEKMLTPTEFERSDPSWDDIEVMQFTGLTDRNGVEIYEGDILQGSDRSPKYHVRFDSCKWRAMFKHNGNGGGVDLYMRNKMFEVIGNIHEHPHLLEAADA